MAYIWHNYFSFLKLHWSGKNNSINAILFIAMRMRIVFIAMKIDFIAMKLLFTAMKSIFIVMKSVFIAMQNINCSCVPVSQVETKAHSIPTLQRLISAINKNNICYSNSMCTSTTLTVQCLHLLYNGYITIHGLHLLYSVYTC